MSRKRLLSNQPAVLGSQNCKGKYSDDIWLENNILLQKIKQDYLYHSSLSRGITNVLVGVSHFLKCFETSIFDKSL